MPAVLKGVNLSLFSSRVKPQLPAYQPADQPETPDMMMLSYVQERARSSSVSILDPNGTPIWLTSLIGQGGQARVFVGERHGKCYAVKSFHRQQVIDEGSAKHVLRELGILSHLTEDFPHPFIVQLQWAFGYHQNLFLVMDWCPEDLHTRLASYRIYRTEGKLYAAQLLAAIHHLHSRCIVHRDIKPSNILLDYQGNIKLSDFGYAIQFDSTVPKEMHQTYSRVGTRGYKAPELLSEIRGPISYPSDIYSYGIVFSQILFATKKKKATYYTPDKISQSRFPRVLRSFLTELTDPIPSARPHTVKAMGHAWFSSIDWSTILGRGYQNPYKPTYHGHLSRNIDLEPIPRLTKRRRKMVPVQDEDLLMSFNYVAPQHSESSQVEKDAMLTMGSASFPGTRLMDLKRSGSSASINSPISSGRTLHSGLSPDMMRIAVTDSVNKNHRDARLKQRCGDRKCNLKHNAEPIAEKVAKDKGGTAIVGRLSPIQSLCRRIHLT